MSYQMNSAETEKRETKALLEAAEELGGANLIVLAWDEEKEIKENGKIINFIPLWKWLLE